MFQSRLLTRCLVLVLVLAALALSDSQNRAVPKAYAGAPAPLLGFGIDGSYLADPATFARAEQTGARWVRAAVYWSNIEPNDLAPANYSWTSSDLDLNPIINAGLLPVVYLTRTPTWAGPNTCGPIDTSDSGMMADFAEVMQALATRYSQVPVWVLYDGVDKAVDVPGATDGCFGNDVTGDLNENGVQDTADYAEMLAAARKAVRQVNANAQVGISVAFDNFDSASCPPGYPGGCPSNSTFNYNFLPELFAYMVANPLPTGEAYADLIGFQYWDAYGPYWESQTGPDYHGIQAKTQFLRQVMQTEGVSFNLYVTMTGEDSSQPSVGLDGQSQCLVTEMVRGAAAELQGTSWWLIRDVPANNWYYGLTDANLDPKPAFKAYQTLAKQLKGFVYSATVSKKQVEAYQFGKGSKRKVVLWSAAVSAAASVRCADARASKSYTFKNAASLVVVDLYKNAKTTIVDNQSGDLDPRVGFIKIKIGSAPMYVEIK